ncbi:alpha/beta fold hydrolase [Bradyrhizobium sp. KBS0727]|uniref:alpha/beta hydrolase n=1 Tax=unclassified Bradyrhizobium TaxID=2631580 RepID=UPI00110F2C09|nr:MULTISPECIES: alpha/beta hydrolase [unclassified Bradyrhizobium]QDW37800.1 alpha/beta fold hydrolase [Bradyrhizobium sp. KBS0725]QDW44404.1 alpha/beta fold hydrolase [Bradyrhizobium sp. KBS0727]
MKAIQTTGFHKHDVRFPAEGGIEISAWLFVPEGHSAQLPAITMAHGYAGTKYHGLERLAEAFASAGFVVLLHDHRNFGDSAGEPRQDINPWQQISDWRRAISYLQQRPEVDENRIGLWGTSYAGGHAIVLGATDRRLKAVAAQVPTIDGYANGLRRVAPEAVAGLEARFAADEHAQLRGEPPARQTIVSADTTRPAAYYAPDAVDFYLQPVPEGAWENTVTIRSTRWARMYAPGDFVERVSPTPLLMVIATHDHIAVTDLALKAYERALEPKRLVTIKGGHFDPYVREFKAASQAAIDWFQTHLG